MSELMSQAEFVKGGGGSCPNCRSGDMEGEHWDSDGFKVWQRVNCLHCGSTWTEWYKLGGFDNFEKQMELM